MTWLKIVNSTQNISADFATIFSKSFVYSSCLSCAQKVFLLILDKENKQNTVRWGKEPKYHEETLSWKKKQKKPNKLHWRDNKIGRYWKLKFISRLIPGIAEIFTNSFLLFFLWKVNLQFLSESPYALLWLRFYHKCRWRSTQNLFEYG